LREWNGRTRGRKESHVLTRQKLLAAAREQIAHKGVGDASVRSISEAAGFSQGAFYSCFDSKESLLLQIFEEHVHSVTERFAEVPKAIEAKIKNEEHAAALDVVLAEMKTFLLPVTWKTSYANLAVELQIHAKRNSQFASRYERSHAAFYDAMEKITERVCSFLPKSPLMTPAQISTCLLSMGVGYAVIYPTKPQAARRKALFEFFKVVVGGSPDGV